MEEESLEGWTPVLGGDLSLAEVLDMAFHYRGNVTVIKRDGTELVGYLFNRDARADPPFVGVFDAQGGGPYRILYSEIENVRFTGKDMAAGRSWEAWVRHKAEAKPRKRASAESGRDGVSP